MSRNCASCGTANGPEVDLCVACGQLIDDLREGSLVNERYRIEKTLGRGGMGAVYRVYDQDLEETLALKVLRGDVASGPAADRRFRDEIKLARKITHPNVCRIFEFGRQGPLSYLTMELVDGVDLRGVLRQRGSLPLETVLEIGIRVCSALQAIHAAGIIHRDLKSANIMMGSDGSLKLMDFGIAKSTEDGTPGATATGMIIGTPEYMSPEQVRAEKLDPRSDIYAMGILLYELFTGRPPLKGATAVETLFKQLHEPTPLQAGTETAIPEPIVPVLQVALAKPREERYASAHEMRRALEGVRTRAGLPVADLAQLVGGGAAGDGGSTRPAGVGTEKRLPRPHPEPTKREEEVATVRQTAPGIADRDPAAPAPAGDEAEDAIDTVQGEAPGKPDPGPRRPPPVGQHPGGQRGPRERSAGGLAGAGARALGALLVVGIAAGVYFGWPGSDTPDQPEPTPTATPEEVPATDAWAETEELASGSRYAVSLRPRQTSYRVGQELVIDVEAPSDGYLNVVNVGRDDPAATLLFPNDYQRDSSVKQGQTVTIPAPGAPFSLPADLPAGRDEQRALLVVIHSRTRLDAFEPAAGGGMLRQLAPPEIRTLARQATASGDYGAGSATLLIRR